jgi:hypothetical protein
MKKLVLLVIIIWVSMEGVKAGNGFNYGKHNRKVNRVKFFNRVFNLNGCKNYKFKTVL